MPMYDYICKQCGYKFSLIISWSLKPEISCPECKSMDVQKKFSPPYIKFIGKGFYSTDNKGKK